MSETKTVLAYRYRRTTADLEPLGAGGRVYIDHDRKRADRRSMLAAIRGGEIVRVLYLRDLGGSPPADRKFAQRIADLGATLEVHRPETPTRPAHRPSTFRPKDAEQNQRMREAWLDPDDSQAGRLQRVIDLYRKPVTPQQLYRRYGKPGEPK